MSALSNTGGNRTFVKVIGTKPNSEEIYFTVNKKVDGQWVNEGKFNSFGGYYKSVSYKDKTITVAGEEVEVKEVNLTITKSNVDYVLSGTMQSGFFRSIVNTIASVQKISQMKLSVAFNKSGYASCYLILDGDERPEWALSWAEQQEMTEETKDKKGKVVHRDHSELIDKLVELSLKVEADTASALDAAMEEPINTDFADTEPQSEGVDEKPVEEEDDMDLPF